MRRIGKSAGAVVGRILRPETTNSGYFQVALCKEGIRERVRIHQLVAAAFIGPCPDGMEVDHKDRNKTNNNYENIRYLTRQDNILHSFELGREMPSGENHFNHVITEEIARQIKKYLKIGGSPIKIARKLNIEKHLVYDISYGRTWEWLEI